ncbi:MAG: hypothetical protein HYS26_04595 [Candidatus Kaiserbacteria bacterium]|nr:MAG: hypothetical protein HYS26_04595 [Candidatus Kaiserbacteria bacterium]
MGSVAPATPGDIRDPAERFDLSYAFANTYAALGKYDNPLKEMSEVARAVAPGMPARCALCHPAEIEELVALLSGSPVRPEVLIDFADGLSGVEGKEAQAKVAKSAGAAGADVVVNLHAVQKRDKDTLMQEFAAVRKHLPEIKVISQIPYLWQFDRESVPWLLDVLAESGVYCVKDWTTRENFLLPPNTTLDFKDDTRFEYLRAMRDHIVKKGYPLIIKIAGRVETTNVRSFINAGATLIGLSYRKAPTLREALL